MDAAALAGLCALLARGEPGPALPPGVVCPPAAASVSSGPDRVDLRPLVQAPAARDGIARVTFAEAGNQGDSGLAAVVYTILNRLQDGRWGGSVDAVLNAPSQFEPVMRAGGDWRRLPPVSAAAQARIDTILNLALDGRLPDLTHGARYFQNPAIVADRARAGQVAAGLVNFGGATPSAVIGAHSFYAETGRGGGRAPAAPRTAHQGVRRDDAVMFVGENHDQQAGSVDPPATPAVTRVGDPSQALFVGPDGRVSANQP
jgi:N-acetylmuramoyl-L-alanine amidase